MTMHPTFTRGQKIRTIYGQAGIVASQGGPNGCMVWLVGEFGWYHPSKIFPA
jgi:hypothetical protein